MARFPFQAKPHISKVLAGLEDPALGWRATWSRRLRPEWVSRSSACQRGAVGTEDAGGSAVWAGVSLFGLTSPSPSGLFLPPLPSSLPPSSLGLPGSPPLFHGEGESLSSLPGRSDLLSPKLLCLASRWIPAPAFASLRGRAVLLCSQLSLEDVPPLFFSLEVFSLLWEPLYVLAFLSGPPRGFQRSLRPAVCPRTRQSAAV